jgi:nucleoid-associated protein YgaU
VLVGLVLYLTAPERGTEQEKSEPAPITQAAPAEPEVAATSDAAPAEPASTAADAPVAAAPAFDVVRVAPSGSAVVAGTAEPGAEVTIYADAAPLAQATADAEGNFVAIFEAPAAATPQALTLGATVGGGTAVTSGEVVMLLPPPPASAESETASAEDAPAEPAVAATAILRADSVEVVPADAGPAEVRDVTLGSISYAEAGEVALAGLGTAGSVLRAYVDDTLAREARVGDDGRWSMDLGDVAGGVYRLRIDQLGADGQVESRIETPFQRDFPRAPLPRPGSAGPTDLAGGVTVQPGHNLWTLARLHYGSGVLYTQIYTANRELIGNPDLIYPGQIFDLPDLDGSE